MSPPSGSRPSGSAGPGSPRLGFGPSGSAGSGSGPPGSGPSGSGPSGSGPSGSGSAGTAGGRAAGPRAGDAARASSAEPVALPVRFGRTLAAARLGAVAVAAVAVALISGHAAAVALAAPPLVLLALRARADRPATLTCSVTLDPPRCVEGDRVRLSLRLELPVPVEQISVTLDDRLPLSGTGDGVAVRIAATTMTFDLAPDRWSLLDLRRARVTLLAPGGLDRARLSVPLGELVVYPRIAPLRSPPRPARLPQLVGEHVVGGTGTGVEFAGIRPYQAGDPVRQVHLAATARYGRPHVVLRHPERLADVVLMIDAYSEVGPEGGSSLDLGVRAAASLADSWLAIGDRVGVVTLSGMLRWLPVGLGRRTLYPIVDSVLPVRADRSVPIAGPPRIPPPALPPGALVVLLSPLLSDRIVEVIRALGERGMAMLVLDTLPAEPAVPDGFPDGAALRLWRSERAILAREIAELGGRTLPVADPATLPAALELARRMPPRGRYR